MDIIIVCLYVSVGWTGIRTWSAIPVVITTPVHCTSMHSSDSHKMLLMRSRLAQIDNLLEQNNRPELCLGINYTYVLYVLPHIYLGFFLIHKKFHIFII